MYKISLNAAFNSCVNWCFQKLKTFLPVLQGLDDASDAAVAAAVAAFSSSSVCFHCQDSSRLRDLRGIISEEFPSDLQQNVKYDLLAQ